MAEEKDPLKITLREAFELYNQEIGTSQKITSFGAKSKYGKYGDIALVDAFKGNKGSRVIDKILDQTDSRTFNTMIDNLRLISQPVRRRIALVNPNDPSLNTLLD